MEHILKALFNDLEKNAYEHEYHKYYFKEANQIIRKHFEAYASQQMPSEEEIKFRDIVIAEYKKGNIAVLTIEGLATMPLKDIIEQPVDGLLYDLNRDEATILTFINERKWVNDYAACKVIRELKRQLEQSLQQENKTQ